MYIPIKQVGFLSLLEEGTHVPVVPREGTASCQTSRRSWPKTAAGPAPLLAVRLSRSKKTVTVLMPHVCGTEGRRCCLFQASELMLYTGKEVPLPATDAEVSMVSEGRQASKEFQRELSGTMAERRRKVTPPSPPPPRPPHHSHSVKATRAT